MAKLGRGFGNVSEPPKTTTFKEIDMGNGKPFTQAEHNAKRYKGIYYTDGGCAESGDAGGWAIWEQNTDNLSSGGSISTTNNEMELTAIKEALIHADKADRDNIIIYCDSQYSLKCVQFWYKKWIKTGWKTTEGEDVKNADLIKEIIKLQSRFNQVTFKWVRGHSGIDGNEKVDEEATRMRDFFKYEL
jgi:ribonuclease HI